MEPVEDAAGDDGKPRTTVHLKVVPGGSKNAVLGRHGDRVRVKVAAPPEGGKANKAVCALLADALGVPKAHIRITKGLTNPLKTAEIQGLGAAAVGHLLYGRGP